MTKFIDSAVEAGAQLGCKQLVGAALRYGNLSNWAPASAGEQK